MKIIIDADACPVSDIAIKTAKKYSVECILVCDNTHVIENDYASIICVDKGSDSADYKIANICCNGDLIITQDYGLATLVLAKGAFAINQNGLVFTEKNIDNLLFSRYVNKKLRLAGQHTKGPKKRTNGQNIQFEQALINLLEEITNE